MATENSTRNAYAVFPQPFMKIEWLYVVRPDIKITPDDPKFKDLMFASNVGSARHIWLLEKRRTKEFSLDLAGTPDPKIAYRMLDLNRVDVVLGNRMNMNEAFKVLNFDRTRFKIFVAKEKPLAVYFGKRFLYGEPEFLGLFNSAMATCK